MNTALIDSRHQRFLTDGGIETTLIFDDGIELPLFAAFVLTRDAAGRQALRRYFERYIDVADRHPGFGFILESPTWRASRDWGEKLGYDGQALRQANAASIELMHELRSEYSRADLPMLVSGCVGPRGDGYVAGELMEPAEAEAYHDEQVATMLAAGAELITAITMTNSAEAIGIARSANRREAPVVISFTVETDGRLPTGQVLAEAIREVDAATGSAPAYYRINCAHPTHFAHLADGDRDWLARVQGIRANASRRSHAELNEATELDRGDAEELGRDYRALAGRFGNLRVFGGCCGTGHQHVEAIAQAMAHPP